MIDQALQVYPGEELLSEHSNGQWVVPNRFRQVEKTRLEIVQKSGGRQEGNSSD